MTLIDVVNREPRPEPWTRGERIPWNDPAFSRRMLAEHLDQSHDKASRRLPIIERQVAWIHETVLGGRTGRVLELCCGPGLYTNRLAGRGHSCRGIDFSPASIEYAQAEARRSSLDCEYFLGDVREVAFGAGYDLVMLNNGELNPFRREDARTTFERSRAALKPDGVLLLEVSRYEEIRDTATGSWYSTPRGLFSEEPHLVLYDRVWYPDTGEAVERYYVIDATTGEVTVHNAATQAYTTAEYCELLEGAGFGSVVVHETMIGEPRKGDEPYLVFTARAEGRDGELPRRGG